VKLKPSKIKVTAKHPFGVRKGKEKQAAPDAQKKECISPHTENKKGHHIFKKEASPEESQDLIHNKARTSLSEGGELLPQGKGKN